MRSVVSPKMLVTGPMLSATTSCQGELTIGGVSEAGMPWGDAKDIVERMKSPKGRLGKTKPDGRAWWHSGFGILNMIKIMPKRYNQPINL